MTSSEVLVIGESLIDVVTDLAGNTRELVGGSPANVALGLARQQVPTRLLTALGRDEYGEMVQMHLTNAGVTIDDASWSRPATSTAHARIIDDGSATYTFAVTWELPPATTFDAIGLVHIGSIAAFLEPGATTLEEWIRRREPHTLATFDPNIRPALLPDREAAVARFERLASLSDLVKLSDEDAEWFYPGLAPTQVAERMIDLGARLTALTFGGEGALLHTGSTSVSITAPSVAVKDTVGAGDSFMAALIHQVLASPDILMSPSSAQLSAAGSYAATAAAITVQRVGANPPTDTEILSAMG